MSDLWELPEEYQEYFPSGFRQHLERQDLVVLDYLRRILRPNKLYKQNAIYKMLKDAGIDAELQRMGMFKLENFGSKNRITLAKSLNNLWWEGSMRKFGKGIYVRSGRPYGVVWMLGEEL